MKIALALRLRACGSGNFRMRQRLHRHTIVLVVAALVFAGLAAAESFRSGRDLDEQFPSVALAGPAHALVVLPAGYRRAAFGIRSSTSCTGCRGRRARTAPAAGSSVRSSSGPAILVEPQGAESGDTDPEYLDWGPAATGRPTSRASCPATSTGTSERSRPARPGDRRALGRRLRRGRARARPSRTVLGGRVVVGVLPSDRSDRAKPLAAAAGRRTSHNLIGRCGSDQRRRPTFFAFYVGRGDARFRAENRQLHRELAPRACRTSSRSTRAGTRRRCGRRTPRLAARWRSPGSRADYALA